MKKWITYALIIVLVVLGTFVLTGCGNTEEEEEKKESKVSTTNRTTNDNEKQYDEFTIYDKTLKLDSEGTLKKMSFMTNKDTLSLRTSGENTASIAYEDDTKADDIIVDYGATVVSIAMRCFEGKTIEEVMSQAPYERTSKTVGGLEYQYFEYVDAGINGYCYSYYYEGSTYTITFEAKIDITTLINAFMKNVKFE